MGDWRNTKNQLFLQVCRNECVLFQFQLIMFLYIIKIAFCTLLFSTFSDISFQYFTSSFQVKIPAYVHRCTIIVNLFCDIFCLMYFHQFLAPFCISYYKIILSSLYDNNKSKHGNDCRDMNCILQCLQ